MLVVVGGHARNVGKTSLITGLIEALPDWNWTALKISAHQYVAHRAIVEETDREGSTDCARFLAAGARRAFLVGAKEPRFAEALPEIRRILALSENAIVESNRILQFLTPDLYLAVVDFAAPDFKESALELLQRADALIVVDRPIAAPLWRDPPGELWATRRKFVVKPPVYANAAIVAFVKAGNLRLNRPAWPPR